ncbi:MAG: hypothetical protein AAB618_03730 [Patescibacteria group bacterium]
MKKVLFEKYKLINLGLFLVVSLALYYMGLNYDEWFKGPDALDFYKYHHAIYAPIFYGGKWLAGILGVLLLFPARIFRKWLFYVAPPILLLTFFLVQGISVYSSNLLNPTRAQMAENGMTLLAIITAIFVAGHLIYGWRKNKVLPAA